MQVIDNFLNAEQYAALEPMVMSDHLDWYWNEGICYDDDGLFQMTHTVFDSSKDLKSPLFFHCKSLLNKLGGSARRIKANLTTKCHSHVHTGFHTDFTEDEFIGKTAVYYVNTNNGYTEFKSGVRVNSIANRMVIFDSKYEHAGVTSTDTNRRVVLNINFNSIYYQ